MITDENTYRCSIPIKMSIITSLSLRSPYTLAYQIPWFVTMYISNTVVKFVGMTFHNGMVISLYFVLLKLKGRWQRPMTNHYSLDENQDSPPKNLLNFEIITFQIPVKIKLYPWWNLLYDAAFTSMSGKKLYPIKLDNRITHHRGFIGNLSQFIVQNNRGGNIYNL